MEHGQINDVVIKAAAPYETLNIGILTGVKQVV